MRADEKSGGYSAVVDATRREPMSLRSDVVIRADINKQIGSGHAVRCIAIAEAIEALGGTTLFVTSSAESSDALCALGRDSVILNADPALYSADDGDRLGSFCQSCNARSVLVDSYAVTDAFFEALQDACSGGCRVGWIDDRYTYELGEQTDTVRRRVDCVINYSFGASLVEYQLLYDAESVHLCIDPAYAPLRRQFHSDAHRAYGDVRRILVTTGSTNDGCVLERMTSACLLANPRAQIDVIVGSMAEFVSLNDARITEHRGIVDLAPFMREDDLCISAAGTTTYELCSVGVPSVIVPVVDNQLFNAAGFKKLGLGPVVANDARLEDRLKKIVTNLSADPSSRRRFSLRMQRAVDGRGAERIARALLFGA